MRGAAVAQESARTARQDRREKPAAPVDDGVPDRVDASVDAMQPPARHPSRDRVAIKPQRVELRYTDDAMLPRRDLRQSNVTWGC
jgi:hypothetical protein